MSGGHFDYRQYHIEDIANSIEKEIEEATKPKPPLVWRECVSIFKKIDDWHLRGIYMGFKTYDEAVKHLKKDKAYKFVREYEKDGKRISEFMDGDKLIEVKELIAWKCKVLQNFKWLLGTTLPDKKYYEITYNGDKLELYIDEYEKVKNTVIHKPFVR